MLSYKHSCLILLVLVAVCYQNVEGTSKLSLRLDSYENPGDRLASNLCCDGRGHMFCSDRCDSYFIFCLDHPDSDNTDTDTCPLGRYQTGVTPDANRMNFTEDIGGTANPRITSQVSWLGGILIKVDVMDHDTGNELGDLVENMQILLNMTPGENTKTISLGSRTTLVLTVNVSCGADYYGETCEAFCAPDGNDHYTCDQQTGAKLCEQDYFGPRCITQCSTENSRSDDPHYTCNTTSGEKICHEGWEGYTCNRRSDPCTSSPCLNQATCTGDRMDQTYTCICADRWAGDNCERHELCADAPCRGPGSCHDMGIRFFCNCNEGWAGDRCEDEVDLCEDEPCENGGTCTEHRDTDDAEYECTCLRGWSGYDCHIDEDECSDNPCNGSQSCQNTPGSYSCYCANGGEGDNCSVSTVELTTLPEVTTPYDPCQNHQCENSAQCEASTGGNYTCVCVEGYRGALCELTDYCAPNPCAHNQPCVNRDDGFTCQCGGSFTGPTCSNTMPTPTQPTQPTAPTTPPTTTTTTPTTPTTPKGERPHWLYAVPRDWVKKTDRMNEKMHMVASNVLHEFNKDVTAEVDFWQCDGYESSETHKLMSVVIRVKGHIQSERKTREVVQEATGSSTEIEVLVGNETAPCYPVTEPVVEAVMPAKKERQEVLYVTGALLLLMTIAFLVAAAILINRKRSRGVFVPKGVEAPKEVEAPITKQEEASRKLVVLRKKDLKLDVNRANSQRDSRIQDNFTPQCFVNLTYDNPSVVPVTPETNPPGASPRPLSIYKKFHYEYDQ